ncbi:MAG: phage holin [Firmicutes bacterium]|nr:phage holin [Bacillota bacterium]
MKINWKVRFKNKTWLLAFIGVMLTFIYQLLGLFEIVPPVSEDMAVHAVSTIINLLVAVGVIIDPTTEGASDSVQALTYKEPKKQAGKI